MQKQKIRTVAEMPPHIVAKFGKMISANLPAGCGYAVILFDAGRADGEIKYVSNAPADLLPKLLATVAWEAKQQVEPGAPMIKDISEARDEALRLLAELKVRLPLISVEDEIDAIEQIEALLNPHGAEVPERAEPIEAHQARGFNPSAGDEDITGQNETIKEV